MVVVYASVKFGVYDILFFFFKQKTAYEMRISDWSSDVCSSDLPHFTRIGVYAGDRAQHHPRVALRTQNRAYRPRDIRWRQAGSGHLIQQRLEQMKIAAIDQGDVNRRLAQGERGRPTGKTGADDNHLRARPCSVWLDRKSTTLNCSH